MFALAFYRVRANLTEGLPKKFFKNREESEIEKYVARMEYTRASACVQFLW